MNHKGTKSTKKTSILQAGVGSFANRGRLPLLAAVVCRLVMDVVSFVGASLLAIRGSRFPAMTALFDWFKYGSFLRCPFLHSRYTRFDAFYAYTGLLMFLAVVLSRVVRPPDVPSPLPLCAFDKLDRRRSRKLQVASCKLPKLS